jgi:hypothetical protein
MAAIFRTTRSTAAHWLALLAGLAMAVSPANLLAGCGCGACPCGTVTAADTTGCCCQPSSSDSCCAAPDHGAQSGCRLGSNCQCELKGSQQPAVSHDSKPSSLRDELASVPGATFATDIRPVLSLTAAAFDSSLLPARPPARILFCVWRN